MRIMRTMTTLYRRISVFALLGALLLAACTDNIWRGEVASVNGAPITLAQITALRNSTHFDWTSSPMAEFDVMRKQYGDALTNLVAVELVKQHLVKKKLSVTAEEVTAEENRIRADYPSGSFEEILVSEAIDLETWRFLLHNYLSVQRFLDKILRRDIVLSPEEVEAYRQSHPDEFKRPPWAYFFLVSGEEKAAVTACSKDLDETGDPVRVQERHPDAVIRTVRMDTPRLDPVVAREVAKLRPGDLSSLFTANEEFHQILLLEASPAREATAREAYLQIEEILVTRKLHKAYNDWLIGRLRKATVKVSKHFLPHLRKTEGTEAAGTAASPS
ncbi:peptidylprolyl isomerase [Desulfovibrio sp. OttesenSCG-928-O18]|nr:peptidylprolyl isomerase [Desulfovibrio sp. OttesenSCG-928-O18]